MGIPVLILGESGTGKSTSLRNMDPENCLLIQVLKKPLPFRGSGWKRFVLNSWETIRKGIERAKSLGKSVVIIDDFQYLMADEFMRRSGERGFDKFTEIGVHAYEVIKAAQNCEDDIRVYFLSHSETTDMGKTKAKTIGKLLDEKITLEGMFTIVMRTHVENGVHQFTTQNSGSDTVKTPMGLFETSAIDNDLEMVDNKICEYYEIGENNNVSI